MSDDRRIVLVTGGNRGIGREVCRQLAAQGDRVLLTARDRAKAEDAAEAIRRDGLAVTPLQLDVTDPESVARARDEVRETPGRIDALVNNAGVDYDTDQDALSADLARVEAGFATNVLGVWRVTQLFLPLLRESGHPRIVNVSSGAGGLARMTGRTPGYSVSKLSLNGITLMFAAMLEADGIPVNAICPGWVETDMGGSGGRPVSEGAASVVWGVTLPDDGPSGGFFRDGERIEW